MPRACRRASALPSSRKPRREQHHQERPSRDHQAGGQGREPRRGNWPPPIPHGDPEQQTAGNSTAHRVPAEEARRVEAGALGEEQRSAPRSVHDLLHDRLQRETEEQSQRDDGYGEVITSSQ